MIRKLRNNKGETMVEALIALLIAVLSLGLVSSATIAAANMNKIAKETDQKFAEEIQAAEIYSATPESKVLTIDFAEGIAADVSENVNVYGESTSNFASYKK